MKLGKKIGWTLLILFLAIQLYRPEKNKSETDDLGKFLLETNPPAEVAAVLESSCYDCHSNNTRYPWYSNLQPVAWWLDSHVQDGKRHLNFSEFTTRKIAVQNHKFEEIIETVEEGEMPMKGYVIMHSEADLSDEQTEALISWVKAYRTDLQGMQAGSTDE